jgi:preprotein translocase subunit Sss1
MSTSSGVTRASGAELLALPDLFLFNRTNQALLEVTTTRVRQPLGRRPTRRVLTYLALIAAIGFFAFGAFGFVESLLPHISGETTQGVVTDFRSKVTRRGTGPFRTSYYITYRFAEGGGAGPVYSHEVEVDEATYYRLKQGSPVEVVYWPGSPRFSDLAGNWAFQPEWALVAVVAGAVVGIIVAGMIQQRRHDRLGERGQFLIGVLTAWSADEMHARQGKIYWDVLAEYRFKTPGGLTIHGTERFSTSDADLAASKLGKHVAVLYMNKKLYEVL